MKKILYICPDDDRPIGGTKQVYRHVDILARAGLAAFVVHETAPFRCSWFPNETPIVYSGPALPGLFRQLWDRWAGHDGRPVPPPLELGAELAPAHGQQSLCLEPDDVLVVPEFYGRSLAGFAPGVRKVVFNQNAYYTFQHLSLAGDTCRLYDDREVLAALVVSADSERYLRFAFPDLPVARIRQGVDTAKFCPARKRRQIACMPRKRREDLVQIVHVLRARGSLGRYDLAVIDNVTEDEVARVLGESLIFLSTSHREGFGLPPAEAMAAGCVVIGYHGGGGREFFQDGFCRPVEDGDVVAFVGAIEQTMRDFEREPEAVLARGRAASAFVREHYALEHEAKDVVAFWTRSLEARRW